MWFAIVVEDPDKYNREPGDHFQKGDVVSWGTTVADANTLKARGLSAVEVGGEQPDLERQEWDRERRELVNRPPQAKAEDPLSKLERLLAETQAVIAEVKDNLR